MGIFSQGRNKKCVWLEVGVVGVLLHSPLRSQKGPIGSALREPEKTPVPLSGLLDLKDAVKLIVGMECKAWVTGNQQSFALLPCLGK